MVMSIIGMLVDFRLNVVVIVVGLKLIIGFDVSL